ncbi:uncharacterized protein EI97DRAFT_378367 [Westerdykella ornata]|uniref:FAD-binding FR-type domain-containing protein n=1 Tax=Westerdykella ornata TaxID=318751 RepID=A0A6A6JIS8_WESOR|nr:uncharacterized protein EI97DRAFT_378367 [Westerdykella ornata]KAF2275858.1 hypothetical protein EI97DRAFT_378367 [Westerdykella ornata]
MKHVSAKASLSHEERTAAEPRDKGLHPVTIRDITPVNERIRLFKLSAVNARGIKFLPGQWLDVYMPNISKAGGFTVTSSPRYGASTSGTEESVPFVELAIQKSPENPVAAWLWRAHQDILGTVLNVRVGGSFVWPPPGMDEESVTRAVFVAGGVGINPLMSMITHICEDTSSKAHIHLSYSTKMPSSHSEQHQILFLDRIVRLFSNRGSSCSLDLHITGTWDGSKLPQATELARQLMISDPQSGGASFNLPATSVHQTRISMQSLQEAIGPEEGRATSVYYVCGPPNMTDSTVEQLRGTPGIRPERVYCEKWW